MKGMNNLGGMPRKYKASTGLKLLKPKLKNDQTGIFLRNQTRTKFGNKLWNSQGIQRINLSSGDKMHEGHEPWNTGRFWE